MKYNINLNQKALIENSPDIDLQESALLDYLLYFCNSENSKIKENRIDGYTWIDYQKVINDMPLLKIISTSSVCRKIQKLKEYGYIDTIDKPDKNGHKRLYIKLTDKIDKLLIYDSPLHTCNELIAPMQRPHCKNATNNSIKDNSIKDNKDSAPLIVDKSLKTVDNFTDEQKKKNKSRVQSLLGMTANEKILSLEKDTCKLKYKNECKAICKIMDQRGWCICKVCGWVFSQIANSLIKQYGDKLNVDSFYFAMMNKVSQNFIEQKAEIINAMVIKERDKL